MRSVLEKLRHILPGFWMISLLSLQALWDNEISSSPEGHKRAPVCPSCVSPFLVSEGPGLQRMLQAAAAEQFSTA